MQIFELKKITRATQANQNWAFAMSDTNISEICCAPEN